MGTIDSGTRERLSVPRWVMNGTSGPNYWALERGCPCCGNMGIGLNAQRHMPCEPAACLLCGSLQCNTRGDCWVCGFGWMPGWSRGYLAEHRECGYAGCREPAVAVVPGKKRACMAHARRKVGAQVDAAIANRDAGKGWQRWTFTGPKVAW